jgi:hypothetical protein
MRMASPTPPGLVSDVGKNEWISLSSSASSRSNRTEAKKYGYIFLPNPNDLAVRFRQEGRVSDEWWGAFTKRCSKIGYKLAAVS